MSLQDSTDDELSVQLFPESSDISQNNSNVPKYVFIALFVIVFLHGFTFFTIFWFISPSCEDLFNISREQATLPAQIYLVVFSISAIFGGLIGDTKCTRYRVILVANVTLMIFYGLLLILLKFIWHIDPYYRAYPYAIIVFVLACCLGTTWSNLVPFCIEQLDDPTDKAKRQSFVRWILFAKQIGISAAYPMLIILEMYTIMIVTHVIILCACSFLTVLFFAVKRYYVLNRLEAHKTIKQIRLGLKLCFRMESEPEVTYALLAPPPVPEIIDHYHLAILRRYFFLVLIFIIFGAYSEVYFMSNIVYPIQAWDMMYNSSQNNVTDVVIFSVSYDSRAALAIFLTLPVLDILYRNSNFMKVHVDDYILMGLGLVFAALSIGTATLAHGFYGEGGIRRDLPKTDDITEKECLLTFQYVFLGLAKALFVAGGYNFAYEEHPKYMAGTFTGLFIGLGSVFGGFIFILQYFTYPRGVNHSTWPYGLIFGILLFTILFLYIPLVKIYKRRKDEFLRIQNLVTTEARVATSAYGSLDDSQGQDT